MLHQDISNRIDRIRLILVDDNSSFRDTLKQFLINQYSYDVIGEASNGEDLVNLSCISSADFIITNLMLLRINKSNAVKTIGSNYPWVKIIAITMRPEDTNLLELIEQGFKGCLLKDKIQEHIFDAIAAINNKAYYFPNDICLTKYDINKINNDRH